MKGNDFWTMEANDFWTFAGLVAGAFAIVVAPRLFERGHLVNSVIYLTGGLLAVTGLAVWATYLITDASGLARAAVVILGVVALLGLVMAVRWIPVRRAVVTARTADRTGKSPGRREFTLPPERNFPLPLVVMHGLFATVTITSVVASVFGGS